MTNNGTTPMDTNPLKLSKPKNMAAGIPAVISSAKHSLSKMGVVKTVKTLSMVNQKHGFDCPGCAWPDPNTVPRLNSVKMELKLLQMKR